VVVEGNKEDDVECRLGAMVDEHTVFKMVSGRPDSGSRNTEG
jgi:hypothetical protein